MYFEKYLCISLRERHFIFLRWVVDVYSPNRNVPTSKMVILNRESSTTKF